MISLGHENLESHYRLNFTLVHHYNYSLTELNDMIPFERQIYITLLMQHLEEEKRRKQQESQMR